MSIRSGLAALSALSCLLVGTADAAQAARPSAKHKPSANHYGHGSGSAAHRQCPPAGYRKGRGYCPPTGSPTFTLTVTNNSKLFQDFVLYQKQNDLGVPNALSLAWLVAPAQPSTTVTFRWTEDYSFVWAQTGTFKPGVRFEAGQVLPTDPADVARNHTIFEYESGGFDFVEGGGPGEAGELLIREGSTVPIDTAAVGIGMADAPVYAVEAQPNINLVFNPHPQYWISAGTFAQGEALDTEEITNEAKLPFAGTFSMTAVLGADNVWTVTPGKAAAR